MAHKADAGYPIRDRVYGCRECKSKDTKPECESANRA